MGSTGILWRESAGKMQWGINVRWDDYDANTPHIDVHADLYVRSLAWGFNDDQVGTLSGSRSFSVPYQMVSGTGQTVEKYVGTASILDQGQSLAGGPTYTFTFQVSGSSNGNPGGTYTWSLPAKPANKPTPPGTSHSSVTSSSVAVTLGASDPRGAAIDGYEGYLLTNNKLPFAGGNVFLAWSGLGARTINSLARGTEYFYTARSHNSLGWSDWTPLKSFKTLPTIPVVSSSGSASSITRNSATISGFSTSDTGGGTLDNTRVQYNTAANETGALVTTRGTYGPVTLTGLSALTTYHFRTAVRNSAGWSAYGPWKSFTTLTAAPDDMGAPVFTDVTDTSMTATWAAPAMNGASFSTYRWELSYSSNFTGTISTGTTESLTIEIVGIQPGTVLYARMRAEATPNNGGWGTGSQKTTGIAPNSGLRVHATVDGLVRTGVLYACVGGTIRELRPMVKLLGSVQTE